MFGLEFVTYDDFDNDYNKTISDGVNFVDLG
jgi:hypothetical protein